MRLIPLLWCSVLLAACGEPGERLPARGDVLIEGAVLAIDMEPMVRDGDGGIRVRDRTYGTVWVRVPARAQQLCRADYRADIGQLAEGAPLRARGAVTGRGEVQVCSHAGHFLASESLH